VSRSVNRHILDSDPFTWPLFSLYHPFFCLMATTSNLDNDFVPRLPKIDFSPVNPNNIGTVRKLNQVLFPIRYSEKFYKDALLPEHELYCQLIYYNDIPVGTFCCRIEPYPDDSAKYKLYIMTMGILAPYRSRGVGAKALRYIIDTAYATKEDKKSSTAKPLHSMYMHVQTSNIDARRFYEKHGFTETGKIDHYYKRLEPHDAWILELPLEGLVSRREQD